MSSILERFTALTDTFQRLGFLGVLAYAGALVVMQMFFVPLAPLGVGAGAIFGFRAGLLAVTLGTNVGAIINFLIARYLARGAVTRYLVRHEKFRVIDAAVGREGGKIVAMLRFCPIPFGLANYAYGLTAVRFWPYVIATFFAILPANCFVVWLGATAQEGLKAVTGAGRARHPAEYVLLGFGLLAGFAALSYITRLAKAELAKSKNTPAVVTPEPGDSKAV